MPSRPRRVRWIAWSGVCAALACAHAARPPETPASPRRVLMVSIDGLRPAVYTRPDELGLAVPNLRRLAAAGAFASGVVGVLPTVTYPSHTTLISGVPPRVHGIAGNTVFDPSGKSADAWLWYSSAVKSPTLVGALRGAGRTTGSVSWPVSVGMKADFLVPEFWRTRSSHASDIELLRALATPGIFEAAEAARGAPIPSPLDDAARTDLALAILRGKRPDLLLLHLLEVDSASHHDGPDAPATRDAIERADGHVGRLLAALQETGLAGSTLVAVVSDHGFVEVERAVRPNAMLVEHGLVELDDKGEVRSWRAWFHVHGGSAALYLADPKDEATRRRVRELVAARMKQPDSGIRDVIDGARQAELGGDAGAELFLDALDGWSFSRTATGGYEGKPADVGYHGYAPDRPALHASLILAGPGLARRGDLGVVPMTRVAGTLARWLGVELPPPAGEALPIF